MHIYQRNNTYYYRVKIPQSIHSHFKKSELHKSLKTANKTIAIKYAKILQAHFEFIKQGILMSKLSSDDIHNAVSNFITLKFEATEKELYNHPDPQLTLQWQFDEWHERIKSLKQQLSSKNYEAHIIDEAKEILNALNRPYDDIDLNNLCPALIQGHIQSVTTIIQKIDSKSYSTKSSPYNKGFITTTLNTPHAPIETIAMPVSKSSRSPIPKTALQDTYENFIKHTSTQRQWTKDTYKEHDNTMRLMLMFFGADKDLTAITRNDLLELREKLIQLPTQLFQKKRYRDLDTLDAIIASVKQDNDKLISKTTVNKYLTYIGSFWEYCEDSDIITNNPHRNLRLTSKKSTAKSREPFSSQELQNLFNAPLYTNELDYTIKSNPEYVYIPLLALFQGARLNELCQLYKEDVKQIDGIWCIDINREKDKSVKNDESVRVIPVHSTLIEAGFIKYVQSVQAERLWPNLKRYEKYENEEEALYSKGFSTWFAKKINRPYVTNDPKKVFHSFRHNAINRLIQSQIRGEHIASIAGHTQDLQMTFRQYGQAIPPRILQEALDQISYPEINNLQEIISTIQTSLK